MGKGPNAAADKRRQLKSGWSPTLTYFSSADDDFIAASAQHCTNAEIAAKLGRSEMSVKDRRIRLIRTGKLKTVRTNKSPYAVGKRPLVAKTCRGCGLLLTGKWFHFAKTQRQWQSRCTRCMQQTSRASDGYKDDRKASRTAVFQARMARMTTPAARSHQPYLESDHQVLADPDLTILEKALKLERSYAAVRNACQLGGHISKFGLGDPERDQWMIDNPNLASDGTLLVSVAPIPEPAETEQRHLEPMWA